MKKLFLLLLTLFMCKVSAQQQFQRSFQNKNYIYAEGHWRVLNNADLQYYQIIDNQITIKFTEGTSEAAIQDFIVAQNLTYIRKAITGWYDFQVNQNTDIFLRATSMVSQNIVSKFEIPTYGKYSQTSNDTQQASQWALDRIQAKQAWDIETGNPSVIVAVIDSGTDWTHEDLGLGTDGYQNIYLNPGEDAWSDPSNPQTGNGIDDDQNGLIDDWKGWNFPSNNNNSRSIINPHGTAVAGIVGGKTNNNKGIAGIAGGWSNEGVKVLSINIGDLNPQSIVLDDAIIYAAQSGAKVIQLTVSIGTNVEPIIDAIEYVYNNYGVLIVCSSGNRSGLYYNEQGVLTDFPPSFPSNHPLVIAIGNSTQDDTRWTTSNYGETLFMVAPGTNIQSTTLNNQYDDETGTSYSSPMVSATIALMWAVNPCLTQQDIKDILASTAEKVGGYNYEYSADFPEKSFEFGYGRLNTYQAVLEAQTRFGGYDLVVKDSNLDTGQEPNTITQYFWASEDIWIRNFQDGGLDHQNPEYSTTVPNYIYVRVKNKGCEPSTGQEKLNTYWAKASTGLNWPEMWNGATFNGNPSIVLGNTIGAVIIPVLQPGEEVVLHMPFPVPNPATYNGIFAEPWHFCLLARVVATTDAMTFPETADLVQNVINNNNIAWKNITIVDLETDEAPRQTVGGVIAVGNTFDTPKSFYLELVKEDLETGKPIYEEAEVTLKMDDMLYQAWERGGKTSERLENTLEEKIKLIKGNHVFLQDLEFNAHEMGALYLKFNFLTEEITNKSKYVYHVIQRETGTNKIIGGETYVVKKKSRPLFVANPGGDKEVDKNEVITIYADQIDEAAVYNWYDTEGNLVYQGTNLTVDADVARKYKLEVIALSDGFKDYGEVEVKIKPSYLNNISPNPASNAIEVNYKLNEVSSAYLMIIGYYGNAATSNNYILDLNTTTKTIDISYYQNGFYTVALVCDGQILDAKTFVKQ